MTKESPQYGCSSTGYTQNQPHTVGWEILLYPPCSPADHFPEHLDNYLPGQFFTEHKQCYIRLQRVRRFLNTRFLC